MRKIEINKLAQSLMLEIKETEIETVEKEFAIFLKQVEELNKIDTNGVLPLNYPFEAAIGTLREDKKGPVLSVKQVLSNTKDSESDMVKIPKVVI